MSKRATKKLFLMESLGKILATDIVAMGNYPEFPTSAMDGYAIKYIDQELGKIKISGINPAGSDEGLEVVDGSCVKTFTGSLMPSGSDTLIPIENVKVEDGTIAIIHKVPFGFAVREVGESYKKDEVLIKSGTKIGFAEIGVMAGLNLSVVEVYETPTIAIASTGSEILDLGEIQTNKAQIRSSNHLTLEALAKKYGANVNQMGVVKDDKASILNLIKSSLQSSDIVVTTGGVSVGDYDFVKDIIKDELGATVLFQGVNIKPGQHVILAQKGDKFIVGLPGFAYSSTVTFILYVLPLLLKFQGADEKLQIIKAILDEKKVIKGNKTTFEACNIFLKEGVYHINFDDKKSGTSAILTNMLGNTGLLMEGEVKAPLNVGDLVDVIIV
ncbi:MAG: molybdopterin molybdotransferase MoeA [Arcobacteraceae bacterium]|nr:molybdopterin molybdotransferase MoeA [Arcobacteraceae bacterium]